MVKCSPSSLREQLIVSSTAMQCTACDGWYHHYCKNLVPYNCGVKDFLNPIVEVCDVQCISMIITIMWWKYLHSLAVSVCNIFLWLIRRWSWSQQFVRGLAAHYSTLIVRLQHMRVTSTRKARWWRVGNWGGLFSTWGAKWLAIITVCLINTV